MVHATERIHGRLTGVQEDAASILKRDLHLALRSDVLIDEFRSRRSVAVEMRSALVATMAEQAALALEVEQANILHVLLLTGVAHSDHREGRVLAVGGESGLSGRHVEDHFEAVYPLSRVHLADLAELLRLVIGEVDAGRASVFLRELQMVHRHHMVTAEAIHAIPEVAEAGLHLHRGVVVVWELPDRVPSFTVIIGSRQSN